MDIYYHFVKATTAAARSRQVWIELREDEHEMRVLARSLMIEDPAHRSRIERQRERITVERERWEARLRADRRAAAVARAYYTGDHGIPRQVFAD